MTRAQSDAASLNGPRLAAIVAIGVLMACYLAGYFFLVTIKAPQPWMATPLTPIRYWYYYGERQDVRQGLLLSGGGALVVSALVGVAVAMPRRRPLHGNARFAKKGEIRKAGLLGHTGIILGRYKHRVLMLPGQQGVMLEAPPRSGKGVGVIIPNLLNWPDSTIVHDVKGENYRVTAGFRAAHGHQVYRFDPLAEDECTACWNPFSYVSDVPHRRIADLMSIARMLFGEDAEKDKFWSNSAATLFLGIALYLFESPGGTRTIGEVLRQGMASDGEGYKKHWEALIQKCDSTAYPLSLEARQALYDSIDLAPVTVSSVRKTFTTNLGLWTNPMIDAATSRSDFDLRDLRKKPISIYCCVIPKNIEPLRPLLNLFWQQAIGLQTIQLPEDNPALTRQLLLMLDEFPTLGRIPVIANSTAFLPGYNVRAMVVAQSFDQLVQIYGADGAKALRKMLAARIVFPPKEFDDAEAISKELGTYTVKQKSRSSRLFDNQAPTINTSDQPRRLLLAQEVKELGNTRAIVIYEGLRPFIAQRIRYFEDALFKRRVIDPPPVPALDVAAHYARRRAPAAPDTSPTATGTAIAAADKDAGANTIEAGDDADDQDKALTPDHIEALEAGALGDLFADMDDIEVPTGRPLTDSEIQSAVDDFFDTLAA